MIRHCCKINLLWMELILFPRNKTMKYPKDEELLLHNFIKDGGSTGAGGTGSDDASPGTIIHATTATMVTHHDGRKGNVWWSIEDISKAKGCIVASHEWANLGGFFCVWVMGVSIWFSSALNVEMACSIGQFTPTPPSMYEFASGTVSICTRVTK